MTLSKEELNALYTGHNTASGAYGANYNQHQADAKRRVWAREHQQWLDLNDAGSEGVFEVTVRSRTQTVTLTVTPRRASQIVCELQEGQTDTMLRLERDIVFYERSIAEGEDADDRAGTSDRVKILALCQPVAASAPAVVPAQSTATPPRLRAARPHREAEAAA
ncbi:hypothetical protein [Hymenobacter negativus]|uniref:Uncharacterized protein n=1 Tax=Hymenobacter negativus TaxID=2795026 RepID=A0ABS3QIN8_9BACT|nr:hypothetical protein [Hymenobacter negativus]MBO2010893.1 hypothetical protein [Hymenobacter negativus]